MGFVRGDEGLRGAVRELLAAGMSEATINGWRRNPVAAGQDLIRLRVEGLGLLLPGIEFGFLKGFFPWAALERHRSNSHCLAYFPEMNMVPGFGNPSSGRIRW